MRRIALDVSQSLMNGRLSGPTIPVHFAQEHCSLNSGNAKIRHNLWLQVSLQPSLGFLGAEEHGQLVPHDVNNQAYVLADLIITLVGFVPDCPDGTASGHAEFALELDVRSEEVLQILPGGNVIANRSPAAFHCLQKSAQNLVYKEVLVFEVVVKLTFSCPGGLDDFARTCGSHAFPMKELGGGPQNPDSRVHSAD